MNKVRSVLVTGAARGIGAAIAQVYQTQGWNVHQPSRSELDLSIRDSITSWVERNGFDVDVLVNNAGENPIGPIESITSETWDRCMMVNLTAPMLLAQAFAAGMRERRWGRIINVISIFSHVSRAGRAPYTAAKSGLLGFTRTAAIEWGPDNVLVNAVAPGYIETDLTRQNNSSEQLGELAKALPLKRLGQPNEVAQLVYFLGSDANTFVTGQSLIVDGGFTAQ